ncbi:hypothetical protein IWX90DRAFT_191797 [Phyllosticta citrichinensis]|uniref:Secreted protein n=1 Tax=Phyllosticta citrichinensis TaxID=1130410 RepID=A0ABR1XWT5_9PEZI
MYRRLLHLFPILFFSDCASTVNESTALIARKQSKHLADKQTSREGRGGYDKSKNPNKRPTDPSQTPNGQKEKGDGTRLHRRKTKSVVYERENDSPSAC